MFDCRSKDNDGPRTQFVVTLDSLGFPTKKPTLLKDHSISESRRSDTPLKGDERKKIPITNRIGRRPVDNENELELRRAAENSQNKSSALKRKRTPIKFEADTKDSEPEKKRRSKSSDRKSVDREYRKSADRDYRKSADRDENRRRNSRSTERESGEFSSKIRTLKTSNQNKYDNLPPRKCYYFETRSKIFIWLIIDLPV